MLIMAARIQERQNNGNTRNELFRDLKALPIHEHPPAKVADLVWDNLLQGYFTFIKTENARQRSLD
jgi:hypothetical protein